ncbi:MAG: hypothetical protein E7677_06590 [Ruminococcaceae bacterium]|nr:hypothetical protein [Oscillospiraceae bacterium]
MNLFEIDFLQKMTTLLKEAFKFKKYKAMSTSLAVFTGILMIPVVIASFMATAIFGGLAFLFAVVSSPVKYLHEIVRGEGKEVKHATQAIIYLISWPAVFALYGFMSFLLVLLLPAYAMLSFLLFVWSLGGFKFHLLLNKVDDISIEVNGKYQYLPVVYVIIGGLILVLIPFIHGVIHYADLYKDYLERYFFYSFFIGIYPTYLSLHMSFSVLYSLIGFARHPKAKAEIADVTPEAE